MRRTPFALGLFFLAATLARPALAEDAEDPAALLRRARTTETADRDADGAIALYRKVMAAAPGSDAARDAGLRLLELLEVRGEKTAALEVATALTERYASRLDDAGKRKVHEAMARMLPAGSKARSPLGEIYVVPPATATSAASPLEAKVLALLPRVDGAKEGEWEPVLRDVRIIGADAVGPLEKILRDERFDRAKFAALALGRIASAEAVEALGRALRQGDGFARSAAVVGVRELGNAPRSPDVARVVRALLDDAALVGSREVLRSALATHAADDEVLERMARAGPDRTYWILVGFRRGLAGAIPHLEAAVKEGVGLDAQGVESFRAIAGGSIVDTSGHAPRIRVWEPGLPAALRLQALATLATSSADERTCLAVADVAVACASVDDAAVRARAAGIAWPYALKVANPKLRRSTVDPLVFAGLEVPPEVVGDDTLVAALVTAWFDESVDGDPSWRAPYQTALVTAATLRARPAYGQALARLAAAVPAGAEWRRLDVAARVLDPQELATTSGAAWGATLAALDPSAFRTARGLLALRVACRRGDPRALAATEAAIRAGDKRVFDAMLAAVRTDFAGPEKARLVVPLFVMAGSQLTPYAREFVAQVIGDAPFPEALADLLDRAPAEALDALRAYRTGLGGRTAARPPASLGARWLAALRRGAADERLSAHDSWYPVARWAALADPAAFVAFARERLVARAGPPSAGLDLAVAAALGDDVTGPDRLAVLVAASKRDDQGGDVAQVLVDGLARPDPDGDFARVAAIAATPAHVGAPPALVALVAAGRRSDVARIATDAATLPSAPLPYAQALADGAEALHLREALPWLVREVKEGDPSLYERCAGAIDSIRKHHARIEAYEGLGSGGGDPRAELEPLLSDADPEIRAAAIVSFGALAGREGLPRLLKLAKDEKDAAVRKAILETIDRVAKAPLPPTSTD